MNRPHWTHKLTEVGWRRVTVVLVTVWLTGITFWSYSAQTQSRAQRRHDLCVRDRKQYDGQITITRFFGEQLGASDTQLDKGLSDLRHVLGTRPDC